MLLERNELPALERRQPLVDKGLRPSQIFAFQLALGHVLVPNRPEQNALRTCPRQDEVGWRTKGHLPRAEAAANGRGATPSRLLPRS
jgi:hypothetical protein